MYVLNEDKSKVKSMEANIRIGQKLRTLTDEYVTITSFDEKTMNVLYKGRTYNRQRSVIGDTLFILDEDLKKSKRITENKNEECPVWIWEEESDQLDRLKNVIRENINENNEFIASEQKYISSGSYEEQDSYMEKSTAYKKISKRKEEIENEEEFMKCPYIAHLELTSDSEKEPINLYLTERLNPPIQAFDDGSIVISLSGGGDLTEKISTNYYNQSLQDIAYNDKTYKYDLYRSIVINESELKKVFPLLQIKDEDEHYNEKLKNITDMFLLEVLNSRRNEKNMPSIIASIQRQQYEIISEAEKCDYVVNGCAGSGKTAIMIHRLHFMKERHKNVDWEKVAIISPSPMFKEYSFGLMKEFNLDIIKQMSIEEFYWSILLEYDGYFRGKGKKILSFIDYESSFIEEFFSNELLNQIKEQVKIFINSIVETALEFNIKPEEGKESLREIIDSLSSQMEIFLSGWKNYKARLNEMPECKSLKKDCDYFGREVRKLKKQISNYSSELSQAWGIYGQTDDDDEKRKIQKKINNLTKKVDQTQNDLEENLILFNDCTNEYNNLVKSKVEYADKYIDIENIERLEKIKPYLRSTERYTFNNVLETCINPIKAKYGVYTGQSLADLTTLSKVELWTLVYIYNTINGNKGISRNSLLCIDEGQNLNLNEYFLIHEIKSGTTFNIYGDLKQKLYKNVGISSWKDLNGCKIYELEQNYRNPESIVQYCNKELNLNMQGFGITGERVTEINSNIISAELFSEKIDDLHTINGGELVIIVKDENSYKKLNATYIGERHLQYVTEGNVKYSMDVINIAPLYAVIGMEFPNVIVITNGMSESQLYVAYTRAMKELAVVASFPMKPTVSGSGN